MEVEKEQICCVGKGKLPPMSARYQWFIAQNLESHNQIFYTMEGQEDSLHYHCQINELHGRRIRACFHNWMILSSYPDGVFWSLWNPLTSRLISLPPLPLINENEEKRRVHECCLSAPPDDQDSSVLLLTTPKVSTIVFCRLNPKRRKRLEWSEVSYTEQLRNISGVDGCFLEGPTCCNGKVYAMTLSFYYRFVIQVDINVIKGEEEVVIISLQPLVKLPDVSLNRCPAYNSVHNYYCFLKGSCNELFYIKVGFVDETMKAGGEVFLFTLDMTSMMWKEMVKLKDAVFFLQLVTDYSTCYYASTSDTGVQGYVHILGELGKILYSFHVKDRTTTISSMPSIVRESQASAWAMLEWRLNDVDHEEDGDTEIVVKGDNAAFDITTGESHLYKIPIHILEMIMEFCIGIEYMKFRATCKYCYLATPPSSETILRRFQMCSLVSPWLIVLDNSRDIITFIDPILGDKYCIKKPQELKGDYQIYCSRYGWLLLYEIDGPMVFFNPFTSSIRELPKVSYAESFCFSEPPTSPDCMVVGFKNCGRWHVCIHFVSKETTWRVFALNFGSDDPYSYYFPTFNGRDVYALRNNKSLDTFKDMSKEVFSWEVVVGKAPINGCRSPAKCFLSNCAQHLLLVIVGDFGESIEVFKLDEGTKEWKKIDGLGKHMVYISDTSCICVEAKSPVMENKIYFSRLLHNDAAKIVFYSLETCRYHTFNDKRIQESIAVDFLGTKHHCLPHTWIEPNWS